MAVKYNDAKEKLSSANHIYSGVSDLEIQQATANPNFSNVYVITLDGDKVLGTLSPVVGLEDKELKPSVGMVF